MFPGRVAYLFFRPSQLLLDLVALGGVDNVGANPDLGNIYWHYEYPEETAEAAIVALAPRSVY